MSAWRAGLPGVVVRGVAATVLVGCGGASPGAGRVVSGPGDLLGDGVVLVSGTVDGTPLDLPAGARVTLLPGGGGDDDPAAVSGVTACNHYGTTMTVDDDRVEVGTGGLQTTEMACEPDLMALESAYVAALPRVGTGGWDGGRLTLAGDGVELVFTGLEAVAPSALVGTTWRLESLVDGETASSTVAGAQPATLLLDDDGTLSGSTGCRTFTGRYEAAADEVQVLELAPEGGCAAELAAQDAHVLEVLGDGVAAVEGGALTITSSSGARGLVYRVS